MRRIIFESALSLDGFVEGPNGELDWLVCENKENDACAFLSGFDTIFYGRKTYERFAVPGVLGPEIPEAERRFYYSIGAMRKYVFSRTAKHVEGNGMVISENMEAEVLRIRDEKGKDIWFCGGPDIMRTFAELDLIDEYVLTVHPVTLSSGKPLFQGKKMPLNLKLVDKQNLKSGIVILHYLPESRLKNRRHDCRSI